MGQKGHADRVRQRRSGSGGGRPDGSHEGKHPVHFDQPLGVGIGIVVFVGIVQGLDLQLAVMDAARLVGLVKRRLDAQAHLPAQFSGRPGESDGLAEKNLGVGNPRASFPLMLRRCGGLCGRCSCAVLLCSFIRPVQTRHAKAATSKPAVITEDIGRKTKSLANFIPVLLG